MVYGLLGYEFVFEKFVKPSTPHPSYILNVHSFTKYINLKDVTSKKEAQIKYKQYWNLLSTLMKDGIKDYFTNYFQNNLNELKSTWKESNLIKRTA